MEQILEVKNLHVHYGMIHAIKGLDFHVNKGEIVTLIGANGAGKTSTLQTITGLIPHSQGEIIYRGENVSKLPGYKSYGISKSDAGCLHQKGLKGN